MVKAKCSHKDCKHKWEYKGKAIIPTCPSCGRKTKIKLSAQDIIDRS